MKQILTITCGLLLMALPLYAQNSTMEEGSATVDSFERETPTSLEDAQEMEDNRELVDQDRTINSAPQDGTDIGSGAGTGTEVQDDQLKTPDDWEEEE